jgi:hypothetical protein
MVQAVPTPSPGSLLLNQAKSLEGKLQDAREWLVMLRRRPQRREPLASGDDACFAAIVDICPGQTGNDVNVVAQLDKAQIQGEHLGTINQGAVDGFVDTLRHCATNIHTRIIILQEAILSQSDEDDAIEVLFHSHILGFELDLLPACVTRLSPTSMRKFQNVSSYMSRYQHPSLMDASANFGMSSGQSGNVAMYLGRRSFGDGTPYTGECM